MLKKLVDFATLQQQSLHATVIRACANCGEAGIDSYGRSVGAICPHCGAHRPADENKGQIWSRRVTIFSVLRDRLSALWRS